MYTVFCTDKEITQNKIVYKKEDEQKSKVMRNI